MSSDYPQTEEPDDLGPGIPDDMVGYKRRPTGDVPNAPATGRQSAEQNPDGTAPTNPAEAAKPTINDISSLRYEMTEEERKAATEKMAVRVRREMNIALYNNPYPTAMDRVMRDIREQERQRIALYGPTLAEQTPFLTEYRANLGLFHTAGLTAVTYERADLLARIAMPATLAAGFYGYDPFNVERVQAYGESALGELEADFGRDGNPVHAWEALAVSRRYGIDPPHWVEDFLTDAADRILDIRDEVADGKAINREVERVGKALGFGKDGPSHGWFKHSTMLERDRTIYFKVIEWLEEEQGRHPDRRAKLTSAYREVAMAIGVDSSTVQRVYVRITKLNSESRAQNEGNDEVS